METARLLLDAGADPNDGRFWHALPTPFTILTGVLGYGEQRQPWHPHAILVAETIRKRAGLVTWAAAQGAPNAVELLVSAGFDVNALGRSDVPSNDPWHTALHVAAENGNLALAQRLLELGAGPNIADKHYKSTPLGWARYLTRQPWSTPSSR